MFQIPTTIEQIVFMESQQLSSRLLWGWLRAPILLFFQIELNCFRNELQKACHAAKGCQESSRHRWVPILSVCVLWITNDSWPHRIRLPSRVRNYKEVFFLQHLFPCGMNISGFGKYGGQRTAINVCHIWSIHIFFSSVSSLICRT